MFRPLLCAAVCLLLYSPAKADTFTLTSGHAGTGFDLFHLFASGPNISITGAAGGDFGNAAFAFCTPSPCAPGSTLDVGGGFLASQLNVANFFGGEVTINGVTFAGVRFSGLLNFTGSVVLPGDYENGQTVFVPFTMQGQLSGCQFNTSTLSCGEPVFDIFLNGSGSAAATFSPSSSPLQRTVIYSFRPAAEPVPEPATLGLFGAGMLAIKLFHASRKRASARPPADDIPRSDSEGERCCK